MGFIGEVAEAILATWIAFWIIVLSLSILTGEMAMATLLLMGLIVPLSLIVYECWKYKRNRKIRM